MEKYQPYSNLKDANIPWYGDAPSHWEPLRFKYALSQKPKTSNYELGAGSISFGDVIYKDSESIAKETLESYQEVLSGEFLINPLNMNYDLISLRTALSEINVVVSTGYIVLKGNNRLNDRFTRWLLHEFDVAHMKTLGSGVRQTITYADIGNSYFLAPTHKEQTQIANFLDRETAKIDTLVEKQQQLIKLLKEKRQAVISHAVTKGLNPNVKMKDSGVEWLGEVPKHWGVGALGYYSTLNTGATPDRSKPEFWGGDIPWIKTGEVRYQKINNTEEYITLKGVNNSSVQMSPPGTLIMAMYGQGVTRGRVAVLGTSATYNQACVAINTNEKVETGFLHFFFMAAYHAIRDGGNETSQMNLNADIVSKFKIVVPNTTEQSNIVSYLNEKLPDYDNLLQKAEQAIGLMSERRAALISAAVTGKIDVRKLA